MKVDLVIPPSAFLLDDRAFPFLGVLQIAAVARERGHEVRVHDLTGYRGRHPGVVHAEPRAVLEDAWEVLQCGLGDDPELVGFYSLAAQHPMVLELHSRVRKNYDRARTVLGGPHASTAPEKCAREGFDWVVVSDQGGGGGEAGFLKVLSDERRRYKRNLLQDPRIVREPSRAGVKHEGDRWPLPARDLIDLESYHYYLDGPGGEKIRATSAVTQHGCPFACTYCSHWAGYRKLETKSPARVAEELALIRERYGWRGVMFYDDEVNLRPDFQSEFLPVLKASGFAWRAFFKGGRNLTKDSVFEQMAASGCVQLCTGAESADPKILKAIKKGATLEDNTEFVRLCVRHGIKPKVFTQVGLPGETPETVEALASWLERMAGDGLADADCSITTPLEGTPIYDHPDQHDISFDKASLDSATIDRIANYKGVPGEYLSFVSHSRLSAEDLVAARQMVEDRFRKAAGLRPLLAKDDG